MSQRAQSEGVHWAVFHQSERITGLFSSTATLPWLVQQYGTAAALPLTFDTTFGTNTRKWPLGLFVCPDGESKTHVLAWVLLAHEEKEALAWAMNNLRIAINCGDPNGEIVPRVLMSDGDASIAWAVQTEFRGSVHLLCAWHLSLNLNDNIRPLFLCPPGDPKQWQAFKGLFWQASRETTDDEATACLGKMERLLDTRIARLRKENSAALERREKAIGSRPSAAYTATGMMTRLKDSRKRWVRAVTWQNFSAGMASSQRVESAFSNLKSNRTNFQALCLVDLVKNIHDMAANQLAAAEMNKVKLQKELQARSSQIHWVFRNMKGGTISPYATLQCGDTKATFQAAQYHVEILCEPASDVELDVTKLPELDFEFSVSKTPTTEVEEPSGDDEQETHVQQLTAPCGAQVVSLTFIRASQSWRGTCTCRAPVGTGMPCLHQTAAAMLPLPPKYGVHRYAADIEMFHEVFRLSTECEDGVPTDSGPQATSTEQDVPLTTRHKHTRHEAELATWTALTRYTEPLGLTLTVCTFWPGVFASLSTPYTSTGQIQSHQDHGRDGSSCGSVRPSRVRRPPESYIGISQGPHEATAGVG